MKLLKITICGAATLVTGLASIWNAEEGLASYYAFVSTPKDFGAYVPSILLLIALLSSWQTISAFFAKPAEKKDIENLANEIDKSTSRLDDRVVETRTIAQAEHAKTRLENKAHSDRLETRLDRIEALLGPEEQRAFDQAVKDILQSDDTRKEEAKKALGEGRVRDAGEHILKIARQTQAAAKDFRHSAMENFREAGTLLMAVDVKGAIEAFESAIKEGDTDTWSYIYLSRLYRKTGTTTKSAEILISANPIDLRDKMVFQNELGDIEVAQGNLEKAKTFYENGLEIAKQLAELDQDNASYKRDLSVSTIKLGDIEVAQGNLEKAKTFYENGLEIRKQLAELDQDNAGYKRDLSVSYVKLAEIDPKQPSKFWAKAYEVLLELSDSGRMQPTDQKTLEILKTKTMEFQKNSES